MTNQISSRQLAVLCCIMMFSLKILSLPSLFYQDYGIGSIFVLACLLIFDMFSLFVVLKLKQKFKSMPFKEIINHYFGKVVTIIIFVLLFVFFFSKICYLFQETFMYLKAILFDEANIFLYSLCLLPVCSSLAIRGERAFARTCEYCFLFVCIGLFFCIFVSFGKSGNIVSAPMFENGINGFFQSWFSKLAWFGDYLFIFLFYDKFEYKKDTFKKVFSYVSISAAVLIFFVYAYFRLYQTTSFIHPYAITDLLQFATKVGNVGKIDIFAVLTVIFLIIFQCGNYIYCCKNSLDNIYNKNKFNIMIINFLIIIICFIYLSNIEIIINIYSNYISYLTVFLSYLLPFILLILSINKNKSNINYKKNKNNIKKAVKI